MSAAIGLIACAVSSLFFGSVYVPIKKFESGDGLFVQWVMSAAIWLVGLAVYAMEGFPKFEPLAMIGGMLWTLGNSTAVPIMNTIGIGMGMLIWGTTNCIAGWACGRFGLFGIHATVPEKPLLNYFGLLLVIIGGFMFSQIRSNSQQTRSNSPLPRIDEDENRIPLIAMRGGSSPSPSLFFAGILYGTTFVPVIYVQDHPEKFPDAPVNGLSYVFAHFSGIFASATVLLIGYVLITKNNPFVNNAIVGPSLLGGLLWGIAQSSWFVANDNLSQAVSFPIISMLPGVCAAIWGVFYFHEIEGARNLRILSIAILTTLTGAVFVGISK
ncbi:unnamed protein product [Caenorhabditis auriculariae]|uniref:Transmembrane protein 144 n=1 Tax=Caenorhabditis auriculariae TaxID=2777116 RepID=A0A8S1GSV5_9PELO|nr:unnamed protein product [Caenorhabditis auriculariae]